MNLNEIGEKVFLDEGNFGKCYELKNGTVLKLFNVPKKLSDIDRFKYMLNYTNNNFLFPFDFVYDEHKFYGYITKKSLGKSLEKSFSSINLENFSTHTILLEENIKKLSDAKIWLSDVYEGNIMYDGNIIEIIDTDFYRIRELMSSKRLRMDNLNYYKLVIAHLFEKSITWTTETGYIINNIKKYGYDNISTSDMILKIKEDIDNYYKENINTINELYAVLRR